ncbi:MAG: hypothetical protein A3E84_01475 [Gammaproteobacteria bacterium RIFCSPHIGHO2_12_FULL_42_13]|nr:MAG: hypothetical protein A3E84_01475 [Gammaproteobacteria bacterium RIFCSPHIGHO2_12_FULL_42_13]
MNLRYFAIAFAATLLSSTVLADTQANMTNNTAATPTAQTNIAAPQNATGMNTNANNSAPASNQTQQVIGTNAGGQAQTTIIEPNGTLQSNTPTAGTTQAATPPTANSMPQPAPMAPQQPNNGTVTVVPSAGANSGTVGAASVTQPMQ